MSNPYAVLGIRDFRLFISARFCVTLAIQIQAVVVGWQVYEITKDPLSLGLIGLAEAVPSIVVSYMRGIWQTSCSEKESSWLRSRPLCFALRPFSFSP